MMLNLTWPLFAFVALGGAGQLRADLSEAMAEQNLEKRADKAMKNADKTLDAARKAYRAGDIGKVEMALQEVEDSVKLTFQSLEDTGKDPRRSSKHFKRAEIRSRTLLRRLDSFRNEMSYTERERIEGVIKTVQKVQQDLLLGIMGKKQ